MKILGDGTWLVDDEPDENESTLIYHMCDNKDERLTPKENVSYLRSNLPGFWPVRDGKCVICDEEAPADVRLYIN